VQIISNVHLIEKSFQSGRCCSILCYLSKICCNLHTLWQFWYIIATLVLLPICGNYFYIRGSLTRKLCFFAGHSADFETLRDCRISRAIQLQEAREQRSR